MPRHLANQDRHGRYEIIRGIYFAGLLLPIFMLGANGCGSPEVDAPQPSTPARKIDESTATPGLHAIMDLFERGVVHPMAPSRWRVAGLAPYASIHQAIAAGDLYAVEDQLRGGASLDGRDEAGRTPLLTAAAENQPHIADFLLGRGANPSEQDALGNSVMHLAARATHIYTLENFHRSGANIEARNTRNYTPLHLAAEAGDVLAVHHLVELGADMFAMQDPAALSIPSVLAARQRHWEVTRYFRSHRQYFPVHLMAAQGDVPGVLEALDEVPQAVNMLDTLQNTPLISAVRTGECEMVQRLLERGADPFIRNMEGDSALPVALRLDHFDCARHLLEVGVNINEIFNFGFESTMLGEAIRSGTLECVAFILDHGGNPRLMWRGGRTALHVAVEVESVEKVRLLIERGGDPIALDDADCSPMLLAARRGKTALLEAMTTNNTLLELGSSDGRRPLHEAASNGHGKAVTWLLDRGVAVDAADSAGRTALHRAALGGHGELVGRLLERGATLEATDVEGNTPLLSAAISGASGVVQMLLERGANRSHTDRQGRNALFLALDHGFGTLGRSLYDQGVAVDARDQLGRSALFASARMAESDTLAWLTGLGLPLAEADSTGSTPLHEAARRGGPEVVRYLLDQGLPQVAEQNTDLLPIHLAAARGNTLILRLLMGRDVDWEARDGEGRAPLHHAARLGNAGALELLLAHGATLDPVDKTGLTPLFLAAKRGHYEAVAVLLRHGASIIPTDASEGTIDKALGRALSARALGDRAEQMRLRAWLDAVLREEFRAAASHGDEASMRALLKAYPAYRDGLAFGQAPVHWAARHGQTGILKLLHAHGANLQQAALTEAGYTPIHYAAHHDHGDTVAWLLESGVPADLKSTSGKTAAEVASEPIAVLLASTP